MTRRLRRFIFLIFVVFFAVSSALTILFAQGYRFDFSSFKIVKTGGIFIIASTSGAKIYIDDKYVESTGGILTHSILIGNLAPKNYNIFIYKENYYPWNKTVEVQNGLVTELNNVILFPLELQKIKIRSCFGKCRAKVNPEKLAPTITTSYSVIADDYFLFQFHLYL